MKRPLLCFALPFVLGICAALWLLPSKWQAGCALVIAAVGVIAAVLWREKRAVAAVVAAGLALGVLWMWGYNAIVLAPMEELCGTKMTAELELIEYPEERDYGARCVVRCSGMFGKMVYYGDAKLMELLPGDKLYGTVSCSDASVVGGQESMYYTSQGIVLRLYPEGQMTIVQGSGASLRFFPQQLKNMLCVSVESIYDESSRGFILALLTGERDALDEQSATDLEESGLLHLTAVSGLHCGFLIAFLGFFLGGNRFLRAFIAYPLLLVYMVMVGCTPSVVRACVMVGFVIAAPVFGRDNDAPTSLGASALLVLLVNPYAISSVSFQLSYAAVAGLLVVSPKLYDALTAVQGRKRRRVNRLWRAFSVLLSTSIGALVFTAPISAYHFKTISIVSPLSNLLVMPIISVLFAGSLLLTLVCMVAPGAAVLAWVPEMLVNYALWAAGLTAKIPGHSVSFENNAMIMWLVLVYAMFAVCWFSPDGRGKYILAVVFSVVSLLAARMLPVKIVENDALTVVAVDVGQGAATLMHSGGVTALVDCGSYYTPRGSGAAVSDAIQLYGWDALDYVVLTHYHEDHAGGMDELLARVKVGILFLPRATQENAMLHKEVVSLADRYGTQVRYIEEITSVKLGHSRIEIYPQLTFGKVNEEGLTVLCTLGEFDLLITGDMSASTERLLLDRYTLPDIEVLMVGHHGSKFSTSMELLKNTMPEVGIISVGENSYGHPAQETLERLARDECVLYRTDRQGNITIRVHG